MAKTSFPLGLAIASALALASCALEKTSSPAKLDRGGFSVDLTASKPVQVEPLKEIPVANGGFEELDQRGNPVGWNDFFQPFTYDQAARAACGGALSKFAVRKVSQESPAEGKRCYEMSFSEDDYRKHKANDVPFANSLSTVVDIPESAKDTKLLLSLKCRGALAPDPDKNSFGVVVYFRGGPGGYQSQTFPVQAEWRKVEMPLMVKPGVKALSVELRQNGCGKLQFDDVRLFNAKMDKGVSIRMVPLSFVDNTFCVPSGQPGVVKLACKNESGSPVVNPVAVVELPVEFKLLDVKNTLRIVGKSESGNYARYRIKLSGVGYAFTKNSSYQITDQVDMMVRTDVLPGDALYPVRYWYEDGDYRTEPSSFNLKVVDAIKGTAPKRFETGAVFCVETNFDDDQAAKALASFYSGCGFNAANSYDLTHYNKPNKFAMELKREGVKRYTAPVWLNNGYRVGKDPKPEDAKFRCSDGSCFKDAFDCICPVEVYNQGPYFRGHVEPGLREILVTNDSADAVMANWEPYMFDFKGCFCPKCKAEFIAYSKLPAAEVEKLWPDGVLVKHKDTWVKFRSWQHGKLVGALEEAINRIGKEAGKDAHFVPEIAASSLTETQGKTYFGQYNPVDFLDKLPVVEPWGPYVFHSYSAPYAYHTGSHMITFLTAKDVKSYVARDVAKPPELIAFPHGIQCDDWLTEPEAIAFETLCFFVNGWDGSMAYLFPGGYDARYWAALAKANTMIARYEDYVLDGTRNGDFRLKPESPLPDFYVPDAWNEGRNYKKILPSLQGGQLPSLLQCLGFQLGDKRLFAVGNFWERGEAFFRLSVTKLDASREYVLREPGFNRVFANEAGGPAFSAAELERGVLLQVGALRWAFLVLEPFVDGADYGTPITPGMMEAALEGRLPEIREAYDFELEYKNSFAGSKENVDLSAFKEMGAGKLLAAVESLQGGKVITVKAPGSRIVLDPANGARVSSWKADGVELVSGGDKQGLCVDGFWWPQNAAAVITGPYTFVKQEKSGDGIALQFKRNLTAADCEALDGNVIVKTYKFHADGSGFDVSSQILNTVEKSVEFSFRFHNMPALLSAMDGEAGSVVFKTAKGPETMGRLFKVRLWRMLGAKAPELEKAFPMDAVLECASPDIVIQNPKSPCKLCLDVDDKDKLYGFVFWDSGFQECSSCEPIFKIVNVGPGKSWTAGMSLTIKDGPGLAPGACPVPPGKPR